MPAIAMMPNKKMRPSAVKKSVAAVTTSSRLDAADPTGTGFGSPRRSCAHDCLGGSRRSRLVGRRRCGKGRWHSILNGRRFCFCGRWRHCHFHRGRRCGSILHENIGDLDFAIITCGVNHPQTNIVGSVGDSGAVPHAQLPITTCGRASPTRSPHASVPAGATSSL